MKRIATIFVFIIVFLLVGVVVPYLAVGGFFAPGVFSGTGSANMDRDFSEDYSQTENWKTYRNTEFGFEIKYPRTVEAQSAFHAKSLNTGIGVDARAPVWKFALKNPTLYTGTNLVDSSLVIHVLDDENTVERCTKPLPGSLSGGANEVLPTVKINGVLFHKDEVIEGGMGKFFHKIIFSTVSQKACYRITQLVETVNVENFVPGTVEPYPEEKTQELLERVTSTFKVIDSSPTFPKKELPSIDSNLVSKSVPKAAGGYVDGIDVSHWQGVINWNKVYKADYKFAFIKATEGNQFLDWYFHSNIQNASDAGVLAGAYHFARPDLDNTGQEEAEYFLSEVGDYIEAGYLRPVLDLEVHGGLGKNALSSWVVEWMETVTSETGVEPLIYTNYHFISQRLNQTVTEYDLWIAYWNCDPTPTMNIPPTGQFADWDFWQYQAPTACGYYSIPGISGNVDLNIFNGGYAALTTFASDAPLWVSLVSDAYQAPRPYYADINADVNGSATGPIDYEFWWNCNNPGVNMTKIEASCGTLPEPQVGQCAQNEYGKKCVGVEMENMLAEHTYNEIGEYTAKVVIHRADATPAEDRYHISVYNPIRAIDSAKVFNYGVVDQPHQLRVEVKMDTTLSGALQAEIVDQVSGVSLDEACISVSDDVRTKKEFNFDWIETETGLKDYKIWARYRDGGSCPVSDEHDYDRSRNYQVLWGTPVIELARPAERGIARDGFDLAGDQKTSQTQTLTYQVTSPPGTTRLVLENVFGTNLQNVRFVNLDTPLPVEILPGETVTFDIQFEVNTLGPFSFKMNIDYNDVDQSPFTITVNGSGISPFSDVPGKFWAYRSIEDLYQAGLISGCSLTPLMYCPDETVTRAEAAVFLERGVHGSSFSPLDVSPTFNDTAGHWAEDWIEALAADEITSGCGGGAYCPDDGSSRAQTAVFLLKAKHGAGYQPPEASGNVFTDVPGHHWAADWIEQLKAEGITVGCGNGKYCPESVVTRAQMAVFIDKTFHINP